jgi:hypothetical protein
MKTDVFDCGRSTRCWPHDAACCARVVCLRARRFELRTGARTTLKTGVAVLRCDALRFRKRNVRLPTTSSGTAGWTKAPLLWETETSPANRQKKKRAKMSLCGTCKRAQTCKTAATVTLIPEDGAPPHPPPPPPPPLPPPPPPPPARGEGPMKTMTQATYRPKSRNGIKGLQSCTVA